MNEKGTKRREWVKTAVIIFLTVMLILTFFSNTIMNYSLPEVAAQYVQSGTITAKIRGVGTVESGDPYEVKTKLTGRTIESVNVKAGDEVQKGDVLFVLKDDEESTDLTAAKDELELAEIAYDKVVKQVQAAFLTGGLPEEIYQNIQSGETTSYTEYYNRMLEAEAKVDEYQMKIDQIDVKITDLTALKDSLQYDIPDTTQEAKAYHEAKLAYDNKNEQLTKVKDDLKAKQDELYEAEKLIRDYNAGVVSGGDADVQAEIANALEKIEKLPALIQTIQSSVSALEQEVYAAQEVMDKKKEELDSKTDNTGSYNALTREIANWTKEKAVQEEKLKEAEEAKAKVVSEINMELGGGNESYDLETPRKAVEDAREKVAKLEQEMLGGVVEAPISGTISSISVAAGNKTSDESGAKVLAVMQPEGKGYSMSFSVTNDQAKRLAVGDIISLHSFGRQDSLKF